MRPKLDFFSTSLRIFALVSVAAAAILTLGWVSSASRVKASPPADQGDPGATILVFRDDTLDDLARLLRPLVLSASAASGAKVTLYLRDAVYDGAVNGEAQLITLWLTADSNDQTALLTHSDAGKPLAAVADRLSHGGLSGSPFVLIPAKAAWRDWTMSVAPSGDALVRASAPTANDIQSALASATSALLRTNTGSVSIPVGYDETKATAWAAWFDPDQIIIRMIGLPASTSPPRPDISSLSGKAGLLVGDGFLNGIFSNEHKDRIWATQTNQDLYRVRDVRFAAQPQSLLITGNLMDIPAPATVGLQATLSGDDLKPSKISGSVDCKSLPIGPCLALQTKINVGTVAITTKLVNQGQPVRPDGAQPLGNFSIGTKALHGISRIDQMQSMQGAVIFSGVFRFQGGRLP